MFEQNAGPFAKDNVVSISPKFDSFGRFQMRGDGLYARAANKKPEDTNASLKWVCSPFEFLGRVRTSDGTGWARMIRFRNEDSALCNYVVNDASLHGDLKNLAGALANLGMKIARGGMKDLADYINESSQQDRVTVVDRSGWHTIKGTECFVLPGEVYGAPQGERLYLDGNGGPFEVSGSLADWQNTVGRLVHGHARAMFIVSASLSACVLRQVGSESGGFHIFGNSSSGKTTVLAAGASCWGSGSTRGFVRTWRATANALESIAAFHNDASLPLDELGVAEPADIATAVYQIIGGQGKGRMCRDLRLAKRETWRTVMLSTGEIHLADKIQETGKRARAGQTVRLIDIPADAGAGAGVFDGPGDFSCAKDLADQIKQAAETYFGTAGPAFVSAIIDKGLEQVREQVLAQIALFRENQLPARADGQLHRMVDRFGLVAAVGELAIELGILPWERGEAQRAARVCFQAALGARGGEEPYEVQAAIAQVKGFIEAHGDARFEELRADGNTADSKRIVSNRVGYRRGRGPDQEWLVLSEAWKNKVTTGSNPKQVARWLAERGMLKRASDGFQPVVKICGRPQRVYILTAALLADPSIREDGS